MARADVLITSWSSFSLVPATLNFDGKVIFTPSNVRPMPEWKVVSPDLLEQNKKEISLWNCSSGEKRDDNRATTITANKTANIDLPIRVEKNNTLALDSFESPKDAAPGTVSSRDNHTTNYESTCLVHEPIGSLQIPSASTVCSSLRRNWSRVPIRSSLAIEIDKHQQNCSLPVVTYQSGGSNGIGSNLFRWSIAMCHAMERGYRLRTENANWAWLDKVHCNAEEAKLSQWLCYFPNAEVRCDREQDARWMQSPSAPPALGNTLIFGPTSQPCQRSRQEAYWGAALEVMFQRVSPLVIQEANRQVSLLFGGRAPGNLISVHIRWGDKKKEMQLLGIQYYIDAVHKILHRRTQQDDVNIYLATEDPEAVRQFKESAPANWTIFVDRTNEDLGAFRPTGDKFNHATRTSRLSQGRAGLLHFASILVALEANDFVLTTASGFSHVLNGLRKSVIDPQCNQCTTMIDLRYKKWW